MATIVVWGPYFLDFRQFVGPQGLLSGQGKTFTVGPTDPFEGTVTVTAHAGYYSPDGTKVNRTALFTADSYTQTVPRVQGDLVLVQEVIWFTLTNVGAPPVRDCAVYVTTVRK